MKKLFSKNSICTTLIKLLVFTLIALFAVLFIVMPQYKYGYNASVIDKVNRISAIDEPKIILVGNSNLPFGIKSEMIEEQLGKPVVNMGIHGGLGNEFHENLIKGNVNDGDLVVICHTDFGEVGKEVDPVLMWVTIENHFSLYKYVPRDMWWDMIKAFPTYVKKCLLNMEAEISNIKEYDECYSRMLFNEYGDNVYSETHEEHYEFMEDYISAIPDIEDDELIRLNKLNEYVNSNGGKMVIAGYPIAVKEADLDIQKTNFTEFKNKLSNKVDCEIISDYTDYFYDYDYFLNTILHMTNEGAKVRTQQLIDDINKYSY